MKTLLSLTLVLLTTLTAHSGQSVTLGALGKATPLKFAQGKVELESADDVLRVVAPNFWSCGWQIQNPALPAGNREAAAPMGVVLKGSSGNDVLDMHVRFVSKDWNRADVYAISLNDLGADEFAEFKTSTAFGQPSEQENGGLTADDEVGSIQFVFKGKGNAPINIEIKELKLP